MSVMRRALLAGESWTVHSIRQAGFDTSTTADHAEGGRRLSAVFEGAGWQVTHQTAHDAARDFPVSPEAVAAWDAVILTGLDADTLLVPPQTSARLRPLLDRLEAIREEMERGGGTTKAEAKVVATAGTDPLIVTGSFGRGRTAAFASGSGPRRGAPPFLA